MSIEDEQTETYERYSDLQESYPDHPNFVLIDVLFDNVADMLDNDEDSDAIRDVLDNIEDLLDEVEEDD